MARREGQPPGLAKRRGAGPARRGRSRVPPSPPSHTAPHHPRRRGEGEGRGEEDEAPAPPPGARVRLPCRLPPPAPRTTPPTATAARGESPGKETTPPLGLRHLRRPGALQGHHGGPGATRSSAPMPGGEQRGVGPALPAGAGEGRSPRTQAFGKGRRECPPRQRTPVPPAPRGKKAGGRGRAGVRTTPNPGARPPRTRHDGGARRSRGGRGPRAEREERSHSPWMPVPRLTRLRPGPGEHKITTSIGKQAAAPRGASRGTKAQRGRRPGGPASASQASPSTPRGQERPDNPRDGGGRLTRGTEPCGAGVVTANGRVPTAWGARG